MIYLGFVEIREHCDYDFVRYRSTLTYLLLLGLLLICTYVFSSAS